MTALIDAWQAALAAEQQAAFGYALLGPQLPDADQDLARTYQDAHETTRDRTAEAIAAAGATPVAPLGDYPALYPQATKARTLAATLEDDCSAAWRYLFSQAVLAKSAAVCTLAQRALTASAVRATRWRVRAGSAHPVTAFPGT